jgi:phosphatase NudJ
MNRNPIQAYFFALVVVRKGEKFLLVHERKHEQRWYLPAGRAEPGETLTAAAERETLEETGIPIKLEGVIRFEHSPIGGLARVRVIFLARPKDDTAPKTTPDRESLGAVWVTVDELDKYPLRGPEVRELFEYVAGGGPVAPLGILTAEGAPLRLP